MCETHALAQQLNAANSEALSHPLYRSRLGERAFYRTTNWLSAHSAWTNKCVERSTRLSRGGLSIVGRPQRVYGRENHDCRRLSLPLHERRYHRLQQHVPPILCRWNVELLLQQRTCSSTQTSLLPLCGRRGIFPSHKQHFLHSSPG